MCFNVHYFSDGLGSIGTWGSGGTGGRLCGQQCVFTNMDSLSPKCFANPSSFIDHENRKAHGCGWFVRDSLIWLLNEC